MMWNPDTQLALLLEKMITRAREEQLAAFAVSRGRIQTEQAAKGVIGGPVAHRCTESAGNAVLSFAHRVIPELLEAVRLAAVTPLPAIEWIRTTVESQIDAMIAGFGHQIDEMKTTAGIKGAVQRLERFRIEARRDADIELSKAEMTAIVSARASSHAIASPADHLSANVRHPMYNLMVSGCETAWNGSPITYGWDRVLEFTDDEVRRRLDPRSAQAVVTLLTLPCLFAYEHSVGKDPLLGRLTAITARDKDVRLDYEITPAIPFLTRADLQELRGELRIEETLEPHRGHWAVKEVDLVRVLGARGIVLPVGKTPVDISTHVFAVALSFPGEARAFVELVAERLRDALGSDACFYDRYYQSQLARPSLDVLLQNIYRNRARLLVVFVGRDYQEKEWCGVEFRAIRDLIKQKEPNRVMYVRMDDGPVDGVLSIDGYLDGQACDARAVAQAIIERVNLIRE